MKLALKRILDSKSAENMLLPLLLLGLGLSGIGASMVYRSIYSPVYEFRGSGVFSSDQALDIAAHHNEGITLIPNNMEGYSVAWDFEADSKYQQGLVGKKESLWTSDLTPGICFIVMGLGLMGWILGLAMEEKKE